MITFFKHLMQTRKQITARRARREAVVEQLVRADCVERDGFCRFAKWADLIGPCEGASEWAHLGEWRRFKTRGLPPELRHHTRGSLIACTRHHRAYDAHEFDVRYSRTDGADGDLYLELPKGATA